MLVRADELARSLETPTPLGPHYPCLPAAPLFLQHPEQWHPVAAADASVSSGFSGDGGTGLLLLVLSDWQRAGSRGSTSWRDGASIIEDSFPVANPPERPAASGDLVAGIYGERDRVARPDTAAQTGRYGCQD